MDFNNLTFTDSLLVTVFSILIVFLVLVSISYLVDATAAFANRKEKKKKQEAGSRPEKNDLAETRTDSIDEMDTKTVAIIMAAISVYTQSDTHFVIRKIERRKATLSEWETAAIQDALRRSL